MSKKSQPKFQSKYFKNWKDYSEYSNLENKDWRQFAWEFLRRNKDYQKKQTQWLDKIKSTETFTTFPTEGPFAEMAISTNNFFGVEVSNEGVEKYCLFHPNIDSPPVFCSLKAHFSGCKLPHIVPENKIFIELSSSLPLDIQIEKIQNFFQKYPQSSQFQFLELLEKKPNLPIQEDKKRYKKEKDRLIHLLRILDALASGSSNQEIISILFKNIDNSYPSRTADSRLRDHSKCALSMVKTEYKELVFLL